MQSKQTPEITALEAVSWISLHNTTPQSKHSLKYYDISINHHPHPVYIKISY